LELGEAIVREMGLDDDTDTLGRWMCHHVASLIDQSRSVQTPALRRTAQQEAVSTILSLWEKRSSLPGKAYPLARYKFLLQCIAATSPSAMIWESNRQLPIVQAAGDLFRDASEIVNLALSSAAKPPLFKRPKEKVPSISVLFLEMIEGKLLNAVEDLDDRSLEILQSLHDNGSQIADPETRALRALLNQIESIHKTVDAMAEQVKIELNSKEKLATESVAQPAAEYTVNTVKKLSQSAIEVCVEILKEGAAVNITTARKVLSDAKRIALARQGKQIIGLAVIKPFRSAYVAKLAKQSSANIEPGTSELGYVAIREICRGDGLGKKLVQELLSDMPEPLFSTTASPAA
jgi:ribosomal protein S18 acetylase RimI-like enzyme